MGRRKCSETKHIYKYKSKTKKKKDVIFHNINIEFIIL